ncbi:MAG: membrane-bound lytic murein transglycosylase MltF [Gammaproteobacteria bacterium]|nr:membrane-bound lytic murein transglycosylase MltF [Gammaproteobacteria bacterium]
MRFGTIILLSILLGSCVQNVPLLERIRAAGELRVVTRNALTSCDDDADSYCGVDYELAQAFADRLGVRLRLIAAERPGQVLTHVIDGQADLAATGLAVTERHGQRVAFGPAYQRGRTLLVHRLATPRPTSLAVVAGRNLEIRAGSSHAGLLERAQRTVPNLRWSEHTHASAETLFQRVAEGSIDYTIVHSNKFELLRHYYPEVQVAFDLDAEQELAWALPLDAPDLQREVAAFFDRLLATGEIDRILARYQASARVLDFVDGRAFVRHMHERLPRFHDEFREIARETGFDWRLLAAIAYQESHWNEAARSPTGVQGLMMLTEDTADIVGVTDRADPRQSIRGGARYLQRVLEKFPERIPEDDRLLMALAAYNIGFGHVEDARIITEQQAGDKDSWVDVRRHLPLLADADWYPRLKRGFARGSVPVLYVDNVLHYYRLLQLAAATEMFAALGTDRFERRNVSI